ncbi:bifunctional transcriptional activator/DNA repair enzyme AdaA [Amycolatopsis sp. NPDC058278]|jgi:AraC family transcriptional regulator of adaptative response/methylated-DNA-[protein]-cysteine methyltransferase|uniref:bifunctional transcriptional activator/DNA repair enzyme AdaA n=1 Tax=unclassified Amycolatopsis TaxID=2618356 RepID=UPI00255C0DC2|nr:Ada metal-binding domain-containing protein [Amycolatopsis sp. DG1A-15b]WIX92217.1 Ada metal-binding domain-containing protein [Amycolatopsis sp. DG1A-15b]
MDDEQPYVSEDERWRAVQERDSRADGEFYYVVRTTGRYSRPSCGTRPARRENVTFYDTADQARGEGYRPCRRCQPDGPGLREWYAATITRICRSLAECDGCSSPNFDELAREVGLSRFHFHRMFKLYTGVTPHAYLTDARENRVRHELAVAPSISEAIYRSGFRSNGHFYTVIRDILGMTPSSFRSGGLGTVIRFAEAGCALGHALVAATDDGVCAVLVGQCPGDLREQLSRRFVHARLVGTDEAFAALAVRAFDTADPPERGRDLLPADVLTAAFRQRVRQAMRAEPAAAVSVCFA